MKEGNIEKHEGATDWIMYNTPKGKVHIEIYVQDETVWLTQQKIADLFGVDRTVVTKHIGNIFKSSELDEQLVCANFAHTTPHGAITGHTAAEIIAERADSSKNNMGLTNWKNSPQSKIRRTDVVVAKNYLKKEELDGLNRIVSMYLDYAENQAKKGVLMYMKDWVVKLDTFLQFNEEAILNHKGKVSQEVAKTLAESEFEKYRIIQIENFESDFDKLTKELKSKINKQ